MSKRRRRKRQKRLREARKLGHRRRRMVVGTCVTLGAAFGLGSSAEAAVDTITVTSLADPGDGDCATNGCTLREAITQAHDGNPGEGDKVVFQSGLSGSIALANQLPLIDEQLYLLGPGADEIQVTSESRVLEIVAPAVMIEGLSLSGGHVAGDGGVIDAACVFLTIKDSTVSGGTAEGRGGGVFTSGCSTEITDSQITSNTAQEPSGGGGIFSSHAGVMIKDSTISGNQAAYGGGIAGSGYVGVADSTIANNRATEGAGGGVSTIDSTTILRSTISGNHADVAGGLSLSGVPGFKSIEQSTIAHNYSEGGAGGLEVAAGPRAKYSGVEINQSTIAGNHFGGLSIGGDTDVYLTGSLVADNAAGPFPDVSGTPIAAFSLIESHDDGVIGDFPNILGSDPQLGPLADNGGPTQTMVPAFTGPAIDQGHQDFNSQATTDQRGQPRPFNWGDIADANLGDSSDIGAVELNESDVPPASPAAPTTPAKKKKCKKKKNSAESAKKKKCKKKKKK